MPGAKVTTAFVFEGASAILMARIDGNDGNPILQANITSILGTAFDVQGSTPDTDLLAAALDKTVVVFDLLQTTDPRWTVDTIGYNFLYVLPGSVLAEETTYRIEIIFTPTSGDIVPLPYDLPVVGLRSQ